MSDVIGYAGSAGYEVTSDVDSADDDHQVEPLTPPRLMPQLESFLVTPSYRKMYIWQFGKRIMPAAYHPPCQTGQFLLVGVSHVSLCWLVCGVLKTSFDLSADVFGSSVVIKHVWYYLVVSHLLVCRGYIKSCQRLKTSKNWTPHTSQ